MGDDSLKLRNNPLYKIISIALFVFVLLTFIIALAQLPPTVRIDSFSDIPFEYLKEQVQQYYETLRYGSFGETSRGVNVWGIIKNGLNKSLVLLIGAIIVSLVCGILIGIFNSKKEKERGSNIKLLGTLTAMSFPDIFVIIVIQAFAVWLNKKGIKIPAAGYESLKHAILPIISLSLIPTAYVARITTMSIDEIYSREYIKTALGKGSSRKRVIWIHVLRNAMVEIADSFSSIATILISSLLVVEYLFYYPGLTLMMYNNYVTGESNVVIAVAIIIGIIYFTIDIIFRIIKYLLNPKLSGQ